MASYQETSMAAIFLNRVEELGDKACVAFKNSHGTFENISWNEMNKMVRNLSSFLISQGIRAGDKVALFSPNRYEWWVADLAILSVGAVNVPIYATNSALEAQYIIENSDSVMCFTGEKEHTGKVLEVKSNLPGVGAVISFDAVDGTAGDVIDLKAAMQQGEGADNTGVFEERLTSIKPSDMATIIYTSGTTGDPKGVMLSHHNFIANVNQLYSVDPELFQEEHTLLSFLPLSHSFERTVGYYSALNAGKTVAFAEDFSRILNNFQEVRPTLIVSVPRLYEKIHAGIAAKVSQAPLIKRMLFSWAMYLAKKNLPYICDDIPRKGFFAFQYNLADKIIFSKLKAGLGMDRLRFALSGGGPLSVSDAEFFLGMGIKVCEGYGLSETTPVTHGNRPNHIKPGTVGPPLKDTIVKIGEGGEVLIKGPQVMMGYYKNEEATHEVFTEDGFFRTGDIGEIDQEGYLKITGRIKDLIVTSGGKNISPQNIENSLKASSYIEQVAIIGDNRKYLSALIVPAFPELENWARNAGLSFAANKDLIEKPEVINLIEEEISANMQHYARVEQIRKFKLLDAEWSQETDELTPTLKIKRRVINTKYATQIESMYSND
ncbi:MAG: long-chain fatty acid--CoA ligase [Deltaproteobacteria bacterium]|nr:long-chain fatty acid--CoA ligase [Deltaproteobacteria bacterium]